MVRILNTRVPPAWCAAFIIACAIAGYVAGGFHG